MKRKNAIIWVITVILSILYLFFGHKIASKDLSVLTNEDAVSAKAKVLTIEDTLSEDFSLDGVNTQKNISTIFTCKILDGEHKGDIIRAVQTEDAFAPIAERSVSVGDKIMILHYPSEQHQTDWVFGSYVRFDTFFIFAVFFFLLLIIFGRGKGVNTLISLAFTCAAVFMVYIPSILTGYNIYLSTLITCAFITVMTLLITNGWSRKTAATILGCLFGVLVAACLSWLMSSVLRLTGFVDEHSIYLTYLPTKTPIDLNAIIFGGIVVGSLGAVMDVAMDIASSLFELRRHAADLTFHKLIKSGITIGRDIMGTMSNTLVLAYIGSSLSTVLLLTTYAVSLNELLNREMIIAELLQALIGSTAILLTIPLTSIICGLMYIGRKKDSPEIDSALDFADDALDLPPDDSDVAN